ncbi:hypothetical protein CHL76_08675 [Marinococcus halophilus]|uniref:Uncharacterized protein n=1 Tax=Marinococcus halophilus TaxID=1371 RepID=A0A510Y502_MARHA|nr:hypothetical protein [Marinococcus halophilus]OZT80170.1 hypothetical protein CHL76_08675 [Marinococcus halophilus]GEK58223.1 hypothetical protein MHA01_11280 [Marinococcus halophilus]
MKKWNLFMLLLSGMLLVYGLGLVSLFTLGLFSSNQFFITIGMAVIPLVPFFVWLYLLYRFHAKKELQNFYISVGSLALLIFALIYDVQMLQRYIG